MDKIENNIEQSKKIFGDYTTNDLYDALFLGNTDNIDLSSLDEKSQKEIFDVIINNVISHGGKMGPSKQWEVLKGMLYNNIELLEKFMETNWMISRYPEEGGKTERVYSFDWQKMREILKPLLRGQPKQFDILKGNLQKILENDKKYPNLGEKFQGFLKKEILKD